MAEPELLGTPGAWESRAFMAALLAAMKGDDTRAGEILRQIGERMESSLLQEKLVKRGKP